MVSLSLADAMYESAVNSPPEVDEFERAEAELECADTMLMMSWPVMVVLI